MQRLDYDNATSKPIRFLTSEICARTGLVLEANRVYEISFEVVRPWRDGRVELTPQGLESWQAPTAWDQFFWRMGSPFRRVFFRGWFHPIARVGASGNAEYFLDPHRKADKFVGRFRTERSSELFLYVNDAVLPLFRNLFYLNNSGEALVRVVRVCDAACRERTLDRRKEQCRNRCSRPATSTLAPQPSDGGIWSRCYIQCVDEIAN